MPGQPYVYFTTRMTQPQYAFLKREAARRGMDCSALIQLAVGFLEKADADRERLLECDRKHGWLWPWERHELLAQRR